MAEKSTKKRPAVKQELLATVAEAQKQVQDRRETELKPEDRIAERAVAQAVAAAEALSSEIVAKDIGQLKSSVGRMLAQLAENLENEVERYRQLRKAIEAKDKELAEIYEIQRSAVTLAALIEAQQKKRDEFEAEMEREKAELEQEIATTRAGWEEERKGQEALLKEQQAAEAKKRDRDRDEYQYKFTREQQQAKDAFADQKQKLEREFAIRQEEMERQLSQREQTIAAREKELADLQQRASKFPAELDAAVAKAVKEAAARAQAESAGREELLKRDFAGERNVLTTRITALEQMTKEQADQVRQATASLQKAYAQVQEIAVRAIEGSSGVKALAGSLQQVVEQGRRTEAKT